MVGYFFGSFSVTSFVRLLLLLRLMAVKDIIHYLPSVSRLMDHRSVRPNSWNIRITAAGMSSSPIDRGTKENASNSPLPTDCVHFLNIVVINCSVGNNYKCRENKVMNSNLNRLKYLNIVTAIGCNVVASKIPTSACQ